MQTCNCYPHFPNHCVRHSAVMMTTPNAWNKMGLVPGAVLIVWGTAIGFWTIWQ